MNVIRGFRLVWIICASLILLASISFAGYLLFSNYQNVHLFRMAEKNFLRNESESLAAAEAQLLQLVQNDDDNERAFIMLGRIAEQKKQYSQQVYFCYQAYKLNPLNEENKTQYIKSLLHARDFQRLENFLAQEQNETWYDVLLYSAGCNGTLSKYSELLPEDSNSDLSPLQQLIRILFLEKSSGAALKIQALEELEKSVPDDDFFLQQEIAAAKADLYFVSQDFSNSEAALIDAYGCNPFAFAPALGRFYANYRSFGQALTVLEPYLADNYDPVVALQTAEIYCLLDRKEKIIELRREYQDGSGEAAMLCSYYFDALCAFCTGDFEAMKYSLVPLRQAINSPLATFMYLCLENNDRNPAGVLRYYNEILRHRPFLDLQERADQIVEDFVKQAISSGDGNDEEILFQLAEKLYSRSPEPFTAKYILLHQRNVGALDPVLLKDALTRFPEDPGIIKIKIEYELENNLVEAEKNIAAYRRQFPEESAEMLHYEIILAFRRNQLDQVSALFQKNFSPDLYLEYWNFATTTRRISDLQFLSQVAVYKPFCEAFILLENGRKAEALDLLTGADAQGNLTLLFWSAKILGENGRIQEALSKYSQFPENSSYQMVVLMNCAELYAEAGDLNKALQQAQQAYLSMPELPVAQYCYADKLYRAGRLSEIVDVVRITPATPWSDELRRLWITGMEALLRQAEKSGQSEKLLELCERLLQVDPQNQIAEEYRQKVDSTLSSSQVERGE